MTYGKFKDTFHDFKNSCKIKKLNIFPKIPYKRVIMKFKSNNYEIKAIHFYYKKKY